MALDFPLLQQVSPVVGPVDGTDKLTLTPQAGVYVQSLASSLSALEFNPEPQTTPSTHGAGWAAAVNRAESCSSLRVVRVKLGSLAS